MLLSNKKLTFSLACFIALFVIAAMPAMAQTIEATWDADVDDGTAGDQPGWDVTLGSLTAADTVAVTFLDTAGTAVVGNTGVAGFGAVPDPGTSTTGTILAGIGVTISVQVAVTSRTDPAVTYQRVDFVAGGPGAEVPETDLTLRPKLMDLTTSDYYFSFGEEVIVTFDFAAAEADVNDAPVADLHISDVILDSSNSAGLQIVSVSGPDSNSQVHVTFRSNLGAAGTSGTSTVTLHPAGGTDGLYALAAATAADGQASVTYDDTAPTITPDPGIVVAAPTGSPTPPDSVWGGGFPVFNLTFSVAEETGGSGLPDTNPVRIDTDRTKLDVGPVGLGTQDTNVAGIEYLVQIRPIVGRSTTAGEAVVITVVPVDKSGNEGSGAVSVKLAASTPADAVIDSLSQSGGNVMRSGTITVTFDKDPGTVTVTGTGATLSTTGAVRTLTVDAAATAGALNITLEWGENGRQVLAYTVVLAPVADPTPTPAAGSVEDGMITLTFAADPGDVTTTAGTVADSTDSALADTVKILTLPAGHTGDVTLGWDRGGTLTLTGYTVPADFVSANPSMPSNIMMVEIPANSYVVLVRAESATEGALQFPTVPPVNGEDVDVKVWMDMPDLVDLFNRSAQNRGGAIVLRKSADARDNEMTMTDDDVTGTYATPARGSVGISEIMWARDLGKSGAAEQAAGQWIELQNLNAKPVKVLIYAQKGSEGLVSGGLLGNTAAGDSLLGNLDAAGTMVIDAVQNIRNDGNQSNDGWNVPGQDGNSVTGVSFVSMHRILPDKQPAYSAAQNYTKRKGTNAGHWAASGGAYLIGQTTHTSGGVTNTPILFEYKGTPGDVNNRTGIDFHTKATKTDFFTAKYGDAANPHYSADAGKLIFNEIANLSGSDEKYEWIEIRNTTGSTMSLKSYRITEITAAGTETVLYTFKHDKNADVAANGVLLLVATDPALDDDHPLSIGYNIDKGDEDQVSGFKGAHVPRYKVMNSTNSHDNAGFKGLRNGEFILVLRRPDSVENKNEDGKGPSETGTKDINRIVDLAGKASLSKSAYPNPVSNTSFWPLFEFDAPNYANNNLTENKVHLRRVHKDNKNGNRLGTGANDNNNNKSAYIGTGWTGIGYRRDVLAQNKYGGTPGYHGETQGLATHAGLADNVVISELMLSIGDDPRRQLPQWIEITNNSGTNVVNLAADDGWRLVIETPGDAIRTLNFKAKGSVKRIYPKQTVLIVAGTPTRNAQAGSDVLANNIVFKSDRVFNVIREYGTGFSKIDDDFVDNRNALKNNDRYRFLNPKQFHMKLIDGKGNVADQVGNLDGNARTNDNAAWDYPSGLTEDGFRTSFIRVYDEGMMAREAVDSAASDVLPLDAVRSGAVEEGTLELNDYDSMIPGDYAWVQAAAINFNTIYVRHTWYGSETDYGTPGALKGQVLAVNLSSFRPALEDGEVVVRWTTEAELDNAGFNIYRSESRDGEFKQVNPEMIVGNGTTGERNSYKWVDATAKPGVVYYYQIEDVSFAGERTALATTRLKGMISAAGKLTTQWGELKNLR